MGRPIGMYSERFFESQRLSMTIEAFEGIGKRDRPASHGIEKDLIDLSPLANLGSIIDQFKRSAVNGSKAEISVAAPEGNFSTDGGDPRLGRDLDFILRLMAQDEGDLNRLRQQFRELFALAGGKPAAAENSGRDVPQPNLAENSLEGAFQEAGSVGGQTASGGREGRVAFEVDTQATRKAMRELRVTMEKSKDRVDVKGIKIKQIDPLVLDLDQNGYDLVDVAEGARFDIDADGSLDRTGWVKGQDALLTLDRNGNGQIDDGKELFGEQNGAANGFAELARFDQNQDGRIDKSDQVFKALKLYRDLNGDGAMQKQEFSSLDQMGIASLNLRFVRAKGKLNGNTLLLQASFQRNDGSTGKIGDFQFGYQPGYFPKK